MPVKIRPNLKIKPSWRLAFYANPFGTFSAMASVLLGGLGIFIGDTVSAGMTNSLKGTANVIAHIWGIGFASGGVMKLWGLYSGRTSVEVPGLWMMLGGYTFYSITVTIGLGAHGIAAGICSGAMAAGCLAKIKIIMRRVINAKTNAETIRGDG
jgi:hypothetical protein